MAVCVDFHIDLYIYLYDDLYVYLYVDFYVVFHVDLHITSQPLFSTTIEHPLLRRGCSNIGHARHGHVTWPWDMT